mmetsp:Transcript_87/g.217  ORF Transcript_87/g.217 Transcript_87/m.217 type:complete len:403 (-) Transcript_87:298-1506(-)
MVTTVGTSGGGRLSGVFSTALARAKRLTGQSRKGQKNACPHQSTGQGGDTAMGSGSQHASTHGGDSKSDASSASELELSPPSQDSSSGDEAVDMSVSGGGGSWREQSCDSARHSLHQDSQDIRISMDSTVSAIERRDVCPDELAPRRPSRHSQQSVEFRRSADHGRRSSERRSRDSRGSIDSYHARPSWEAAGSLDEDAAPAGTRSEDWAHVFRGNEALGVPNGVPRPSLPGQQRNSEHSVYSRSSADVASYEAVLSSSLYSETAVLPSLGSSSRRSSGNDAENDGSEGGDQGGRRDVSEDWPRRPPPRARPEAPPADTGCYVDSLTMEQEAAAIVSPATRLAIAPDGMKYRSLARSGTDRHAHHREAATNAQLARAAFHLPSVRDVEHQRCRTQLRSVVPR